MAIASVVRCSSSGGLIDGKIWLWTPIITECFVWFGFVLNYDDRQTFLLITWQLSLLISTACFLYLSQTPKSEVLDLKLVRLTDKEVSCNLLTLRHLNSLSLAPNSWSHERKKLSLLSGEFAWLSCSCLCAWFFVPSIPIWTIDTYEYSL